MTPTEQRIAIATICGKLCKKHKWKIGRWWRDIHEDTDGYYKECSKCGIESKDGVEISDWYLDQAEIPDYLNDLNAMHKVEKLLMRRGDGYLWHKYLNNLESVCIDIAHATAEERAKTFLRTIGKY